MQLCLHSVLLLDEVCLCHESLHMSNACQAQPITLHTMRAMRAAAACTGMHCKLV